MAYTVSGTPSASAQTLNKALQGIIELPENLRQIDESLHRQEMDKQRQARADRYADAQLRLMEATHQDRINNLNAQAELVNALSQNNGQTLDVQAANLLPYLAKTGNIGIALQLLSNANSYTQQKAQRDAQAQAQAQADKATASWFASMSDQKPYKFMLPYNSIPSKQPTAQELATWLYSGPNAQMSPEARRITASQILNFQNTKTQQPVKFGTYAGQPYATDANGKVIWGSRPPTPTQEKPDELSKFIVDGNGNIYPRELPKTEVWENGKLITTGGGLNPAYVDAYKRKYGYPVEKTVDPELPAKAVNRI